MKRHFNALLQRKRIEFENTDITRRGSESNLRTGTAKLQAEDGYDWLQKIRRARCRAT